ncbi:bifunctional 4-hydroxy-2-oxoglutarate aldolase/2-dehydro-3-deoxy-phosphogluconate aldolase [Arthrobacter sp. UYEF20]|uniref:bifunctional 4-hydroxy-2-oxoglutarate aldolase/2-dehydro-3-deoxy-phosphogluconate aldolase n=1 Tax=Arthrobacter sp. UYEF20 TaxID=1756363 RepID=UPI003392B6EC
MNLARPAPSRFLLGNPVVAVLRARHAGEYGPVIAALAEGGVRSIEVTLSTAGVFDLLPALARDFGYDVEIGVGTVTTPAEAEQALDAGARFLVTPVTDSTIVHAAVERAVPVFPGGLTPTELLAGWRAGATAVKVFPASAVGPGYISQLRGPFPDLEVIPSGGVAIEDAASWISAGAMAVSLGGPLLGDAFKGGDLGELTQRAAKVSRLVAEALHARDKR